MQKRILCFGDSNTWGANPADGSRHESNIRWTGVLQKELGNNYCVIEEGYNGRTTVFDDPVEDRLSGISYFKPCFSSQSPLDLVIIMLGTNDLKLRFGVEAQTSSFRLKRYLDVIKIASSNEVVPEVLLVSPIHIDPSYKCNELFNYILGENAVERSKHFAKAYENFAKEQGIHYMDASKYGKASVLDGVHMEAESHKHLGMAFANKIREIWA